MDKIFMVVSQSHCVQSCVDSELLSTLIVQHQPAPNAASWRKLVHWLSGKLFPTTQQQNQMRLLLGRYRLVKEACEGCARSRCGMLYIEVSDDLHRLWVMKSNPGQLFSEPRHILIVLLYFIAFGSTLMV